MTRDIRELAQLAEAGKGCDLLASIESISPLERVKVMKQAVLQSQIDSLDNPQLPSLSLSLSTHPSVLPAVAAVSLWTGDWSGIGFGGTALVTERFPFDPFSWIGTKTGP